MKYLTLPLLFFALSLASCKKNENKEQVSQIDSSDLLIVPDGDPYEEKGDQLMREEAIGYLHLDDNNFYADKVLGPFTSESEPVIWENDGSNHKTVTYPNGVILDMVEKDSIEYVINSISVMPPSDLETAKGIKVGSSLNDVIKAYDEYIRRPIQDSSNIVAGSIYGGLIFGIENGKVSRIFLGASAE